VLSITRNGPEDFMRKISLSLLASTLIAVLALSVLPAVLAPAEAADEAPTYGPAPKIFQPEESIIPTIKWAEAGEPWPADATPKAAPGLKVGAFARDLKHPRWLYVLPNGDVLAAEAATQSEGSWWPRALAQTWVMRQAGAITESANRITLLRDTNGDGVADQRFVLLEGLRQPFGMALVGDQLYVANTDSVVRFPYSEGTTRIEDNGTKILDLPVGHHWTRSLLASPDGSRLYVTVGSGSNIGENGLEKEEGRATVLEVDLKTGQSRIYASGLRNANGMVFEPTTGALWTVVNERDEIGDDVPPDYLTSVKEGGFYGWPYSYWGQHVDVRVSPQRPDLVAKAIRPDYALGAHTASLGLAYYSGDTLSAPFRNGMFIGQHGSWNRSEYSGYKVIFVPFKEGRPDGMPVDVLTGFLRDDGSGKAYGRPVGVVVDKTGALLVADDVGNTVWRVSRGGPARQSQSR
jgi:glucose/arabinose dehydrogenase